MIKTQKVSVRDRLGSESGAAMLIAIVILMVVLVLAAAVVWASSGTNRLTRRDTNYKNALQAAEAGLQIGLFRLNWLAPSSDKCVGNTVQTPDSTGTCASSTYTLGNGSSYHYYTTPALDSSATCAGLPLSGTDVVQRCITSVGTSNGVTARSQTRVGAFSAQPLFQIPGATGRDSAALNGNGNVKGNAGSNGTITQNGNGSAGGVVVGPAGTFVNNGTGSSPPVTRLPAPIVLAPVNTGDSATNNEDFRITNGLASPPVTPYDQSSANGVSFNASTRTLSLAAQSSLTLGGGVYNFCQINATGGATISIAPGAMTEIYIDSPDDPNSGCPAGSGNLLMAGGSNFITPTNNPLALQIYVYGLNNGTGQVNLTGNATMYGTLYAPQSVVNLSGNGTLIGGVVGRTLNLNGNGVDWDSRAGSLQATTIGTYYRTAWSQCSPTYSASAPGAGC